MMDKDSPGHARKIAVEKRLNAVAEIVRRHFPAIDLTCEGPYRLILRQSLPCRRRGYADNVPLEEHIMGLKQYLDLHAAVEKPVKAFLDTHEGNIQVTSWSAPEDSRKVTIALQMNEYTLLHYEPERLASLLYPACSACMHLRADAPASSPPRHTAPASPRARG